MASRSLALLFKWSTAVSLSGAAFWWLACATIPDFQIKGTSLDGGGPQGSDGSTKVDGSSPPKDGGGTSDASSDASYKYLVFLATGVPGNFAADAGDPLKVADGICAAQGAAFGQRNWRAMITVATKPTDAVARLGTGPGGWYNLSGSLAVASDPIPGALSASVSTSDGGLPDPNNIAWTGRLMDCGQWREQSGMGSGAKIGSMNLFDDAGAPCSDLAQDLYCFEVP